MYYPDLSLYSYYEGDKSAYKKALNIGWLDASHPFPQGDTSAEFQNRLWEICCFEGVLQTMGYHVCEFCPPVELDPGVLKPVFTVFDDVPCPLGSREIRVRYRNKLYAAPNLVSHYVTAHHYLPPEEFIEAVLQTPRQSLAAGFWPDDY